MTKEEIIEMAKEVNLPYFWESGMPCNLEALEAFATLVAEKALETKDEPFEYWNAVGWFGYDAHLRLWFEADKNDDGAIPLYKDQQQRTWVGLTYEEETELIRLAHNHAGIRFYIQAAEAKLKEKNT